jgi:hypothetical protein
LTTGCVNNVGWGVGLGYSAAITVLIVWLMISFPGYYDVNGSMDQYSDWYYGLDTSLNQYIVSIWTALTIIETTITIYSVCKIFGINKELSLTNPNVKINKKTMVLHTTLLII